MAALALIAAAAALAIPLALLFTFALCAVLRLRYPPVGRRVDVGPGTVVVHSLAGVLGLAMALEAPAFTRGLVLLAPVSHPWPGGVWWYYTVAADRIVGALFRWLVVPIAGIAVVRGAMRSVFAP